MRMKVQKWGNSLACRIPRAFAAKLDLSQGVTVEMDARDGSLVIMPVRRGYSLEQLLAGVKVSNIHAEEDFGQAQGREIF